MDDAPRPGRGLHAGTVGRAHGLDGSVHVVAPVGGVFERVAIGAEIEVGGQMRRVARLAGHPGRPILRLEGAEDRAAADALRGQAIVLPRDAVGPLDEDEWWAEELEGCVVRDGERPVGTVTALLALPSCEVLEVRRAADEAAPLLVPLVHDAVRSVDVAARVIDVDLTFLGEA